MTKNDGFKVYFLGVGGVSMSALAIYLKGKGLCVGGCDKASSESFPRLENAGVKVDFICDEQIPEGLKNADAVIYTSALSDKSAQFLYAQKSEKILYSRAELLREIADSYPFFIGVSGTHGKTACTCLLAHIFKSANERFFAHIGGFDSVFGNCFYSGKNLIISEICEYKRNISLFSPSVGVILNVDNDHLESYGGFSGVCAEFFEFGKRSGVCVYNADDKVFRDFSKKNGGLSLSGVSFSIKNELCDYYAKNVRVKNGVLRFDLMERGKNTGEFKIKSGIFHNVYNALGAIGAARLYGIGFDKIRRGLWAFSGVSRREEWLGEIGGVRIFADYCHHPAQIRDILDALNADENAEKRKLIVIFQPHTYSRTRILFEEFVCALSCLNKASGKNTRLIITDTYAAREEYDYLGSGKLLASALSGCEYVADKRTAAKVALDSSARGDVVAFLGAGDIYYEATELFNRD